MSKKKLLEESTIRSFMKLANLQPLTAKFLKESEEQDEALNEKMDDEEDEEEEDEEEEDEEEDEEDDEEAELQESSHVVFGHDEDAKSRDVPQDRQNPTSGAGGGHKKAPKKTKVEKPGKMDAAKHAPGDAKLKPMKQTSHHSVKGHVKSSDEQGGKSNASTKNNSTFEIVSESLEEEEMDAEVAPPEAPEGGMEADSQGESPEHKEKMKAVVHKMLDLAKEIASQYGMEMEVSDGEESKQPSETPEMPPPSGEEDDQQEEDEMKMEQLDEMVEKLTKRVAARLVKESKKKR